METTLDRISSTEGRLKVILTEADYKPEVDKKIKSIALDKFLVRKVKRLKSLGKTKKEITHAPSTPRW